MQSPNFFMKVARDERATSKRFIIMKKVSFIMIIYR